MLTFTMMGDGGRFAIRAEDIISFADGTWEKTGEKCVWLVLTPDHRWRSIAVEGDFDGVLKRMKNGSKT